MKSVRSPDGKGTLHYLKAWPTQFEAVKSGKKKFEWRKNDRDFAVGDALVLEKYDPAGQVYMQERLTVYVEYIMLGGFGLPDGYCIMSISKERSNEN